MKWLNSLEVMTSIRFARGNMIQGHKYKYYNTFTYVPDISDMTLFSMEFNKNNMYRNINYGCLITRASERVSRANSKKCDVIHYALVFCI